MLKSKPKGRKKESPLFKILNAITYTKENLNFDDDAFAKTYDQYMINRWLSMVDMYTSFINDSVNRYSMSNEEHFLFLRESLPKQRIVQWNYVKKDKDLTIREKKCIADHFELGLNEAEIYIDLLSKDMVDKLLNMYRHGRNKLVDV